MKKINLAIIIALCMTLCLNVLPVYGADKEMSDAKYKTAGTVTENNDSKSVTLKPPASVRTYMPEKGIVRVSWNKVAGATEYIVYRSTEKSSGYKLLKRVTATSYKDKNIYSGEAFYYKVRAVNSKDSSLNSKLSASARFCVKPAAPVIKTVNNNGKITISWKKVYGAQRYYIYVYSSKQNRYIKVAETSKLAFTHTKAMKNTFLYYKVKAVYKQEEKLVTGNLSSKSKVLSRYVNPDKKMVAMTFDDGPSIYTKEIVSCLYKYDSASTFFVVGNRIDSYKDTVLYTYKMGCELANHSYSHPLLTDLTSENVKSQVRKTDNKIKAITGKSTSLIRVPYGGYNDTVKKAVGKPMIQWSDDTLDWKTRSKSATVNYVMENVQDGDIILMHDIHKPTKEAALELIPKLRNKGYQLVTVSELAKYKGYTLKSGAAYSSFR